jgi:hypothetical protein
MKWQSFCPFKKKERKEERGDWENDLDICHDKIINRMHLLLDIVS